jgi:hypothetical protein
MLIQSRNPQDGEQDGPLDDVDRGDDGADVWEEEEEEGAGLEEPQKDDEEEAPEGNDDPGKTFLKSVSHIGVTLVHGVA